MGKTYIHQQVPDHIIDMFNYLSIMKFGDNRGRKQKATIEALKEWCEREQHRKDFRKK